jgi:hypothetical protein
MTPPERPAVTGGPPPTPERDPSARYRPDPQRQSPVWQAVKWPIRKLLLGIYYLVQAARRHKVFALVVVVVLVALIGAGIAVRQLTQPPQTIPDTPVSVTHFLHGRQTGNVQEMYSSLDPNLRNSDMQSLLQNIVAQDKSQGLTITNYNPVEHYPSATGGTVYVYNVVVSEQGQSGNQTYTFIVGSNRLIQNFGSMIVISPA